MILSMFSEPMSSNKKTKKNEYSDEEKRYVDFIVRECQDVPTDGSFRIEIDAMVSNICQCYVKNGDYQMLLDTIDVFFKNQPKKTKHSGSEEKYVKMVKKAFSK